MDGTLANLSFDKSVVGVGLLLFSSPKSLTSVEASPLGASSDSEVSSSLSEEMDGSAEVAKRDELAVMSSCMASP